MKQYSLGRVVRTGAWGVVVGGMAGFALGLMLAPEEGRKIRRRIAYQLENLGGQVGQLVEVFSSREVESEARRSGAAVVADAREQASRIRDDIDALLLEIRRPGTAPQDAPR